MKQPYLIQRLELPRECNIFSFGGGYKNGGLSDEAMKLIKHIFSFDYMGAAEFEFGAMPRALQYIAQNHANYISSELSISTKEGKIGIVYILCNKEDLKDLTVWLKQKGKSEWNGFHTKESVRLNQAINDNSNCRTKGWLDIDNGFFFFTNKEMFEKTKQLFEIK